MDSYGTAYYRTGSRLHTQTLVSTLMKMEVYRISNFLHKHTGGSHLLSSVYREAQISLSFVSLSAIPLQLQFLLQRTHTGAGRQEVLNANKAGLTDTCVCVCVYINLYNHDGSPVFTRAQLAFYYHTQVNPRFAI